jgi:hypothetical protein
MSEEAYKRKRVELTLAVKSEICKYSIQNRNLKQKDIREHFNQKFSTEIGKSTLSKHISYLQFPENPTGVFIENFDNR